MDGSASTHLRRPAGREGPRPVPAGSDLVIHPPMVAGETGGGRGASLGGKPARKSGPGQAAREGAWDAHLTPSLELPEVGAECGSETRGCDLAPGVPHAAGDCPPPAGLAAQPGAGSPPAHIHPPCKTHWQNHGADKSGREGDAQAGAAVASRVNRRGCRAQRAHHLFRCQGAESRGAAPESTLGRTPLFHSHEQGWRWCEGSVSARRVLPAPVSHCPWQVLGHNCISAAAPGGTCAIFQGGRAPCPAFLCLSARGRAQRRQRGQGGLLSPCGEPQPETPA